MLYATNFRKSDDIICKCRTQTGAAFCFYRPKDLGLRKTQHQQHDLNQPAFLDLRYHGGIQ